MGVLEFFGSLVKHNVTSSSIKTNFTSKMVINHLFLDFNSIIHVSSRNVVNEINTLLELVLKNIYNNRSINSIVFTEKFQKYKMIEIQKQIKQDSNPNDVIKMFHNHFTEEYIDKLIITSVINTILHIIRTYCTNKEIKTILLAIDGVPSKGKMVEQRQRRYTGAIAEEYEKRILKQYKEYLLQQPDFIYLSTKYKIEWSRNKINTWYRLYG